MSSKKPAKQTSAHTLAILSLSVVCLTLTLNSKPYPALQSTATQCLLTGMSAVHVCVTVGVCFFRFVCVCAREVCLWEGCGEKLHVCMEEKRGVL